MRFLPKLWLGLAIAGLTVSASRPAHAVDNLPLWSVCEVTRETATRPANAFTSVDATATFTGPGGATKTVRGFVYEKFDENVVTHNFRARYKFRLAVTTAGAWNYTVSSSETGLNLPTSTPINLADCQSPVTASHGFLRRDATSPLSFVWDDGQHAFVWGQTYYQLANNARCVQDGCTDPYAWQTSINNTASRRIAKVRLLIAPWNAAGRGSGVDTDVTGSSGPYLRTATTPFPYDRSQLDLAHWQALDTVIRYLYDKGMVAELSVFRDSAGTCGTGDALVGTLDEDKRFLGYAVARYAAFPNVTWSLTNEWQCTGIAASRWDTMGGCLKSGCSDGAGRAYLGDPWFTQGSNLRPLTIHPNHQLVGGQRNGQCFSFFGSTWPSSVSLQWHKTNSDMDSTWAGDLVGYNGIMCNKPTGSCQGINTKSWPVSNDEYGYIGIQDRTQHRNTIWGLATGGGYGTAGDVTGSNPILTAAWQTANEYSDIQRVIDFFAPASLPLSGRNLPYWTMNGAEACGDADRIHVLADGAKSQLVVYFATAATNATIASVPNTFYHRWWYNPRTPTSAGQDEIDGGCTSGNTFTTLDQTGDWVLRLKKCPIASCAGC